MVNPHLGGKQECRYSSTLKKPGILLAEDLGKVYAVLSKINENSHGRLLQRRLKTASFRLTEDVLCQMESGFAWTDLPLQTKEFSKEVKETEEAGYVP